jgi:hypothetical protein
MMRELARWDHKQWPTVIAQNLRRLAKLAAQPPPAAGMCPG